MVDKFSKKKRREIMQRVRTRSTEPEQKVRQAIRKSGINYRSNVTSLPGKPDIVLPENGIAIFVHGCFWHGHPRCARAAKPTTNVSFWDRKIETNIRRDRRSARQLRSEGWSVHTIWACQAKTEVRILSRLKRILKYSKRRKEA